MLDRFEEVRLVDDAEFADMWVRSRSQTRKLAKGALQARARGQGHRPGDGGRALEQLSDEDECSRAAELVERKLRADAGLRGPRNGTRPPRRLASMLARKGYQPRRPSGSRGGARAAGSPKRGLGTRGPALPVPAGGMSDGGTAAQRVCRPVTLNR